MKEAKLIMPLVDNDGRSLAGLHKRLRSALAAEFGGYTMVGGLGGWVAEGRGAPVEEPVAIYAIAMYTGMSRGQALRQIALKFGREAGQECVYIRYNSGKVKFVEMGE